MADRSPNFPAVSLKEAVDMARLIYQREGRSKMPRLSAVKPLGYSSINGRSLSILGALRAYGLLDGRGDEVRLSDDAITLINAPASSEERDEALVRAFSSPNAFALLNEKGDASADTLRWHLIKANFRDDAADKLLKVYLESRDLVNAEAGGYNPTSKPYGGDETEPLEALPKVMNNDAPPPLVGAPQKVAPTSFDSGAQGLAMSVHERILQSGMLSKTASYRVIVSGQVGVAEIDRLLKKLEMDKDILAAPDPDENLDEEKFDL